MTRYIAILFKVIALGLVTTTTAGPMIPISIDQLSSGSQLIVRGTVAGKSVQKDDEGRIYTRVDLSVKDVWKGTHSDDNLTIVHSGGILGNQWASAEGEVSYSLGEEVVVFLLINSRGEGVTRGMSQGKFHVHDETASGTQYVQGLFHGGPPPKPGSNKGYRFPTQLPLTVDLLKRQVLKNNS